MKAWLLRDFRGLGAMEFMDVDDPVAHEDELRLKVHYAALNPADRYLAQKQYPAQPPLPHVLGRDGVGEVDQIGANVTGWKLGEVLTQWQDLPGEAVTLVTGASGGVGVASIQLAAAMGYRALGLTRGTKRHEALKNMGAEMCFDVTDPNWPQLVKNHLKDRRVDLAIDNVGGPGFSLLINTLANRGRVSVVGRLAGPVPEFNTASLFFRRIRIGGVAVGAYTAQETQDAWREVVALLSKTGARPVVDQVFPFDQLIAAFDRLAGEHFGKVLLAVAPLNG